MSTAAEVALRFLHAIGVRDTGRGLRNVAGIVSRLGAERLTAWQPYLARAADPDMALNNLERFLAADGAVEALDHLLQEQAGALDTLIGILAASQFLSDTLATQPAAAAMLGLPLRHTPTRAELVAELQAEVDACFEDSSVLRTIREYRARQLLRIGTNDIFRDRPLEELTADIATVAEAAVEVALATALRGVTRRFGLPVQHDGRPGQMTVLAFGKLGGRELNYSSDIDLMVVFADEGQTQGPSELALEEFYSRVTTEMLRLLTAAPAAYRVDFRLRPEGQRGPLVRTLASTLAYYDTLSRTWERQALIKVRPIAGDAGLGRRFLEAIEPFVYRKYLSYAEINEIKVIKRKIEQRSTRAGESLTDVKTGFGGIRDVEFVIQFLQLLNGGDLPDVRQNNTLLAIQALLSADCLTPTEGDILEKGYRFLRKTEHRLQLLSDLQTHNVPEQPEELRRLALRLGYADGIIPAEEQFECDFRAITGLNRQVLNHLLHEAFPDPDPSLSAEADLILLPDVDSETATQVLSRYGFKDVPTALQNLHQLGQEPVPFLPTRRCRHFLASIAPQLLRTLAATPDPDMALTNLEKVTASLGAKGVLWELFSYNQPSLKLYVELCAWSQYLSQILMSHPGMIDELLDTLVLDQPKSLEELSRELAVLTRGAEPALIDRILHSFQNKELLRIGVRNILGKTELPETLVSLSDLAEVLLNQIVDREYDALCRRWGVPMVGDSDTPCRFVWLGLGKFGGREMSYHSDLDLILVYEADGRTSPAPLAHARGSECTVPSRDREGADDAANSIIPAPLAHARGSDATVPSRDREGADDAANSIIPAPLAHARGSDATAPSRDREGADDAANPIVPAPLAHARGSDATAPSRDREGADDAANPIVPAPLAHARGSANRRTSERHADALAYFLTFHTYATWLHGRADGSVDRHHNTPGAPVLPPDMKRELDEARRLKAKPVIFNAAQRGVVERTIREVCAHRGWTLHALNVRTNHVHVVVTAPVPPERVLTDFKAYTTRRLVEAGRWAKGEKVWSRHGSTRYLWTASAVAEKCQYVIEGQGADLPQTEPLAHARGSDGSSPSRDREGADDAANPIGPAPLAHARGSASLADARGSDGSSPSRDREGADATANAIGPAPLAHARGSASLADARGSDGSSPSRDRQGADDAAPEGTDNYQFFSELAQRVIKALGHLGPLGRLYQVDMRLRPTGKSGSLATPLEGFRKYYREGQGQLWERQSLTRARVVHGDRRFGKTVLAATHDAAYGPPWQPSMVDEILAMRKRLEESRGERDLKRGVGGIVDVEFLVQLLLLKYAKAHPELRQPNIWLALRALQEANLLRAIDARLIREHYDYLRRVESRLRIVHNQSLDSLPAAPEDLTKLAKRLGYSGSSTFLTDLDHRTAAMRERFLSIVQAQKQFLAEPPSTADR